VLAAGWLGDKGIGTCFDRRTGELVWRKRFGGAFTASPVAGDGKLYFCNEEGGTLVIAAGTKSYRELAHNPTRRADLRLARHFTGTAVRADCRAPLLHRALAEAGGK
jgi:outer membrane protein assembly factor BamB